MKTAPALLALSLALSPALVAAQHGHGAHDGHGDHAAHAADGAQHVHAAPADIPADHVPWLPDDALVQGMARVRLAVATLAHLEMGHLGADGVLVLAGDIDAAIDYMFTHCRLEPEPDVALHGVLARLMAGTRALREHPGDAAPVTGLRDALADYGRLFDDPGQPAAQ